MGNAGFLLRLADAARDFVVDGLVVGGFAAQQTTQRNDGVSAAQRWRVAGGGGNLPRAGNADDSISARSAPLRRNASSAPSSRRSVTTAFQRQTTMANFIPAAERSPSMATGLPFAGSDQAQKLKRKPGSGSTVKRRDFQCVSAMGERRATAASPPFARSQASAA